MNIRSFTRAGLHRFLFTLESSPADFVTIYVTPDSFPEYLEAVSSDKKYASSLIEIRQAIETGAVHETMEKHGTGAAIFWNPIDKHIVLPSFLIPSNRLSEGKLDLSLLHQTTDRKYLLAVIMVTWGWYALGMFDGDNLVESKVGTGHIHKKHKKGGQSQKRFARRTEEQKRDFLRRVGNHIGEKFGGYQPDYIFFGGNRLILKPLIQESRYLQSRTDRISPRILDVRYADRDALNGSLTEINRSLVFTF